MLLVLVVGGGVYWWRKSHKADLDAQAEVNGKLRLLIWLCKLVLPAVSQTIFKTFRCQRYDDGEYSYLLVDHDIDCDSHFYRQGLVPYAALMVLAFPVGMPLTALVGIVRLKPHLDELQRLGKDTREDLLEHPVLGISIWRSLFKLFKPRFAWWYEVADIARRLALTCGTLVFLDIGKFILFSVSVALFSHVVHNELTPYSSEAFNRLVSAEHLQNLLCIIMLLINDADMFEHTSFELVGVVLLVTNLGMLLVTLFALLPSKAKVHRTLSTVHHHARKRLSSIARRSSMTAVTEFPASTQMADFRDDQSPAVFFDNPLMATAGSTEVEVELTAFATLDATDDKRESPVMAAAAHQGEADMPAFSPPDGGAE